MTDFNAFNEYTVRARKDPEHAEIACTARSSLPRWSADLKDSPFSTESSNHRQSEISSRRLREKRKLGHCRILHWRIHQQIEQIETDRSRNGRPALWLVVERISVKYPTL